MFYFEDFSILNAIEKEDFIKKAIIKFKATAFYNTALEAQAYYQGENTTILKRLNWFFNSQGEKEIDKFKANNKICSEFFPKIIKQENSYLLANGLTTDDKIKIGLGTNFDVTLQKGGIASLVDGVSWGYTYIGKNGDFNVDIWRGTEFIPIFAERTGELKAGIRFVQSDVNRPIFVEFYEITGISYYTIIGDKIIFEEKKSYKYDKLMDILGERLVEGSQWSCLPIFPLYGNDTKKSEFTTGLKTKIDMYDIISSDFGNNLEDNRELIYLLKNYSGQDVGEFLADLKFYNVVKTGEDGSMDVKQIEIPFQARQTALEIIKKQIYEDSMALDTSILKGGSLTNIAIKAMLIDLDLKTDSFENNVIDFCTNIINMYLEFTNQTGSKFKVEFIRRSIVNDTEIVENILKMRSDISHKTALILNPYIENADKELKEIEKEEPSIYRLPLEPKEGEEGEG